MRQRAGTASGNTGALEFASCMRSHGVASFPDPSGPIVPGIKQLPAFRPAMQTCNKLYPSSRSTGRALTEAQRTAALARGTTRLYDDHNTGQHLLQRSTDELPVDERPEDARVLALRA